MKKVQITKEFRDVLVDIVYTVEVLEDNVIDKKYGESISHVKHIKNQFQTLIGLIK